MVEKHQFLFIRIAFQESASNFKILSSKQQWHSTVTDRPARHRTSRVPDYTQRWMLSVKTVVGRTSTVASIVIGSIDQGHKQTNNVLLFMAAKGWIKSTCTRKHIKEIHTNTSNTANVIDDWL